MDPRRKRPSVEELRRVVAEHQGQIRAIARAYDVDRRTIYRWVKGLEIDLERWRTPG